MVFEAVRFRGNVVWRKHGSETVCFRRSTVIGVARYGDSTVLTAAWFGGSMVWQLPEYEVAKREWRERRNEGAEGCGGF